MTIVENLAGNIEEEYAYSDGDSPADVLRRFCSFARDYSEKIGITGGTYPALDQVLFLKTELVNCLNLWVNFQKAAEWNPPHCHSGLFSFVTYLQVPPEIRSRKRPGTSEKFFSFGGCIAIRLR